VAWVAEIPVPYRVELYRRLREEGGIDLKLFFCAATQADRDWSVSLEGVPHVVMRGGTVGIRPREQFFLRINPQVWRELSRFRPDAVIVGGYAHVTMQLAMLWCRRHRKPYLINSESHQRSGCRVKGEGGRQRLSTPFTLHPTSLLKRFFIRGAAAGLPAGTLAREYLVVHGGPVERMFPLPNACDVERFARESAGGSARQGELRAQLNLGPGPVVLYVGRLAPVKGLETLLKAFAEVRRRCPLTPSALPQLLLVGEGEQRGELEALTAALGLGSDAEGEGGGIRFAGSQQWKELPRFYGLADLFVLPSTFEPWGAVVHEAMACGLPVVVSDRVGCAPDLVRPAENGWIVPAGDVDALTRALRQALSDDERLASMGAASARLALTWGEDTCLEALVQAVRSVLPGRDASGARADDV
jgi:glycosyltransferase involved in cell wall biosynthesis